MNILVTGGAGFIGSHLCDLLLKRGHNVTAVDNLSLGCIENIEHNLSEENFYFEAIDLLNFQGLEEIFREYDFECVFHLCANSDISKGNMETDLDLKQNFITTYNVLECMRNNSVKQIVFASTSAVYGEFNGKIHENSGPLFPVSFYGASKLAAEAYVSAFASIFDFKAWICRFPNVVGERATHGVILDFINKLKRNPKELEILGDGEQNKPYLYVKDLVEAMVFIWQSADAVVNCFNIGIESRSRVTDIASMVVEEMELKDVNFNYAGGGKGWMGDVPQYEYSLEKINKLGWKAKCSSNESVRISIKKILNGDSKAYDNSQNAF